MNNSRPSQHRHGTSSRSSQIPRSNSHGGARPKTQQIPHEHQNYEHPRESQNRLRSHRGGSSKPYRARDSNNSHDQAGGHRSNKPISLGKMKHLVDDIDDTEVLHTIMSRGCGFLDRLQMQDTSDQHIQGVLDTLKKALGSKFALQTSSVLLQKVNESVFLMSVVPMYITSLYQCAHPPSSSCNVISSMIDLLEQLTQRLPTASLNAMSIVIPVLKSLLDHFSNIYPKNFMQQIVDIEHSQNTVLDSIQKKELARGNDHAQYELPPDDYREISIMPKPEDILTDDEPYLRKNNVFGTYVSVDDYLDTQFRLLREDCIQPLRTGIRSLKKDLQEGRKPDTRQQDIRVYTDVRIMYPIGTSRGVAFRLKFNVGQFGHVKWESTKRLLTGSLVCLSKDSFKTIIVGTIADHEATTLEKGYVDVFFQGQYLQGLDVNPSFVYYMVESSAYFEAYRYNLAGLQQLNEDRVPFAQYLLNTSSANEVAAPLYLRGNDTRYDFSCLVKGKKCVKLLDAGSWPTQQQLKLDDSQYGALCTALTKEFSVIQGPPGTGKTYIGLKIVQLLMQNQEAWNKADTPILVVCYTNHALDQFLEGIRGNVSNDDILVRVGGRCQSEILQDCMMKNLKRSGKIAIPNDIGRSKAEIYAQLDGLKDVLQNLAKYLMNARRGIFHENYLRQVMQPDHYNKLVVKANQLNTQIRDQNQKHHLKKKKSKNPQISKTMSAIVTWLLPVWVENSQQIDKTFGSINEDQDRKPPGNQREHEEESVADIDLNIERLYNMDVMKDIQKVVGEIEASVGEFREHALTESEIWYVASNENAHHVDQDGFQSQMPEKIRNSFEKVMSHLQNSSESMSPFEAAHIEDIWKLSEDDRWRLYRCWVNMYLMLQQQQSRRHYEEYNRLAEQLQETHSEEDYRILKKAKVIGMTTTGAAKNRDLLQRIQPRIVIVEEAAEVLEAHIVTYYLLDASILS